MLKLQFKRTRLPFVYPFRHAKGEKTYQEGVLVSLRFGKYTGYGEATEIAYYNVSAEAMEASLIRHKPAIESYALNGPERFWHFLHHLMPGQEFLIAALDMAAWDIWGQLNRKPVRQLLRMPPGAGVPTSYTLGILPPEAIAARVAANPFGAYKLKVDGLSALPALQALRSATTAAIRIDANESWTLEAALELLPWLEQCGVELIEQPFRADDRAALEAFRSRTKIPLIADEACKTFEDLEACLPLYDGINIKLSKCGGLTPAFRMAVSIKQQQKLIMLGGMCESYVGATAVAQLLPVADFADIDGPLLLKENCGSGITYGEKGRIQLPEGPGMGTSVVLSAF